MHNESGFNPPLSERTYHKPSAFGGSAFPRERNLADPGNDRGARFLDQKGPVRGRAEAQGISQTFPRRGSDGFTGASGASFLAQPGCSSIPGTLVCNKFFMPSGVVAHANPPSASASIWPLTSDVVRQTGSKESAQSRHRQNHDAPRERRQAGDNDSRLADR